MQTKQKSAFENLDLKEKSTMTYLFGPLNLIISSDMVDCINKFVACAQNHDYEPYSKPKTGNIFHILCLLQYFYCGIVRVGIVNFFNMTESYLVICHYEKIFTAYCLL